MDARIVCTLCGKESTTLTEGLAHVEAEHPLPDDPAAG